MVKTLTTNETPEDEDERVGGHVSIKAPFFLPRVDFVWRIAGLLRGACFLQHERIWGGQTDAVHDAQARSVIIGLV